MRVLDRRWETLMRRTNPYYSGPKSNHFNGFRFHSPVEPPAKSLLELAWMLTGKSRRRWRASVRVPNPDHPPERVAQLRLSSAGHSSILIQVAGLNLLVDPIWTARVSPVRFAGPKRAHAPAIAFDDLPPINAVLITHNHYDHLDGPTMARLWRRFRPRIIAPLGNDAIIRRFATDISVETYDWGDRVVLSDSLTLHLEPAFHWSGRRVGDRRMALWCAFVLRRRQHLSPTPRAVWLPRRGASADRSVRATLVHASAAREPGRGGSHHARLRGATRVRPPLGHVPAHARTRRDPDRRS